MLGSSNISVRESVGLLRMDAKPAASAVVDADKRLIPSEYPNPFVVAIPMNKATMLGIFFRSLTIQLSFNFRTMQGLGFAFSLWPLLFAGKSSELNERKVFLLRHLQMFSTNPYLVPAVIGSVARLEEEGYGDRESENLKKALMGPYAAIGDSFFWGALRLFCSAWSVLLAVWGSFYAPFMFLLLFSPAQIMIRVGGFIQGFRYGRDGFNYVRSLDLPRESSRLRYGALFILAIVAAALAALLEYPGSLLPRPVCFIIGSAILLISFMGARREVSAEKILYGIAILCMVLSI